ncbi:MAG: hypothetical protein B0A82_11200 [Alkalinema sp. CACIAM 70d]|nr:MAG: hypothetical protein B0A82_11200 [Alkalinema sp. CACIAM 70d]
MTFMGTGSKSALADALARIKGEPGNTPHWTTVAKEVAEIRNSGEWRGKYASPTEWLEAAAKASGRTPNTIRRFLAAWTFLENSRDKPPFDPFLGDGALTLELLNRTAHAGAGKKRIRSLDIGVVELAKRINDIAPNQAVTALQRYIADDMSYRDVKRLYDQLVAGKAASLAPGSPRLKSIETFPVIDAGKLGLRRVRQDKESLAELLSKEIQEFSGTAAKVFAHKYSFEFVAPDAVSIGRDGFTVEFVDGFALEKLGSHPAPGTMRKVIAEAAFSSTFFRRYWLLIDGAAESAAEIARAMETLQLSAVGIAIFKQKSTKKPFEIILRPSNKPSPDRHDLSRAAVMNQGVPSI